MKDLDVSTSVYLEEIADGDPLAQITGGSQWPWAVTTPGGVIVSGFDLPERPGRR